MIQTPKLLTHPVYHDEEAARAYIEEILWPNGPFCPFCGSTEVRPVGGPSMKPGWYYCSACNDKFTVRVRTIFERSHIPLHKWLMAFRLMSSSKKGCSAHQLHRSLGITYKSAWFLAHRIREAMRDEMGPISGSQLGGANKVVEADETYVGGKAKNRKNHVPPKEIVLSLVERGGTVRSCHVADVSGDTLGETITKEIDRASYLMTDDAPTYPKIGARFSGHGTVNHSAEEYVRAYFWHTNTVEGYFSILKRGIIGTYHHVSAEHLHRYLSEFDFRYNARAALGVDDMQRTQRAIKGAEGKRLTYRRTAGGKASPL
jgi:transposase-like protein